MEATLNPSFIDAVRDLAILQAEVLECVNQNRARDLEPFNDDIDECPVCGAPLYDDEPCCEGEGE